MKADKNLFVHSSFKDDVTKKYSPSTNNECNFYSNKDKAFLSLISNVKEVNRSVHSANADTGTDGNYICVNDMKYVSELIVDTTRHVCMPDGRVITSTHSGLVDLPSLPTKARKCWIFKELIGSLLCPGDWVDSGATVIYTELKVMVNDRNGVTILTGDRVKDTKLWMIDLNKDNQPAIVPGSANATTYVQRSKAQLVAYYSGCLGFPSDSTFNAAVAKGYITPPGLTREMATENPANAVESALGHLDHAQAGIRSTATEPEGTIKDVLHPSKSLRELRQKQEL